VEEREENDFFQPIGKINFLGGSARKEDCRSFKLPVSACEPFSPGWYKLFTNGLSLIHHDMPMTRDDQRKGRLC
jgi:hypothetical protein